MNFLESDLSAKQYILTEAFASGTAEKVIDKLTSYLSKKINSKIYLSPKSMDYENSFGKFSGYLGILGDGKSAIRINFLLGKSDYISSVDYYDSINDKPKVTVEFSKTDNIVEIANSIESLLKGNMTLTESYLKERKSFTQEVFRKWVNQDKRYYEDLLQNERFSDLYRDYFESWVDQEGERPMSFASFSNTAKAYLQELGLNNKYARKGIVKKSSSEKTIVDKSDEKKFDNQFALTVDEKYEQIESFLMLLANGYQNSLVISGSAGIGKSHTVLEKLKKAGLDYHLVSGGVKSTADLYKSLYYHKDGELIVYDDCDDVLTNKNSQNLLKAILDSNPNKPNTVSYVSKDFLDPKEIENLTPRQKEKAVPNTYNFTSGIIFITNVPKKKLNQAVLSRSLTVDLDLTKDEILQRIESKIDDFPPDAPVEYKKKALDFFRKYQNQIKRIDFRTFDQVTILALTNHPAWEKWAFSQIL